MVGNTSTHVRFPLKPAEYMDKWFMEAPTHHCAMSVGHNQSQFIKIAKILDVDVATV